MARWRRRYPHNLPLFERVFGRVEIDENDCWNFTGPYDRGGYGTLQVRGKSRTTHRLAWEIVVGPIPDGLHVLHHCDNRRCLNLTHLYLGTNKQNVRDRIARGRSVSNPLYGERHQNSKLDWEKVTEIRLAYMTGEVHLKELASEYGVGQKTIHDVVRGKTWPESKRPELETA